MRTSKALILCAFVLALSPGVASAQSRLVHVNVGGGPTFSGGDIGNAFSTGWGPAIGVTIGRKYAFQFEYAYRWFDVEDYVDAQAGIFSANHKTHQFDFNFVANLTPEDSPTRAYVIAGPGVYQRNIEITKYAGTGVVCDPFYYICGTYPLEQILGSRGGWDFGFNIGGGVAFALGDGAEFYIESRYHYVVGPDIQAPPGFVQPLGSSAAGKSTNGHYTPLTFGLRF
jgi:hypothetical protein